MIKIKTNVNTPFNINFSICIFKVDIYLVGRIESYQMHPNVGFGLVYVNGGPDGLLIMFVIENFEV